MPKKEAFITPQCLARNELSSAWRQLNYSEHWRPATVTVRLVVVFRLETKMPHRRAGFSREFLGLKGILFWGTSYLKAQPLGNNCPE
ncbi:hypothetical protein E2C01_033141 [Portunus trituberculatus]|uniref:Uncharacterized protein n=1 Tax=Portunus trituberculatus TaxID=210409 RepID=A0A5B7EX26_PORTR|nr:hypothetical protein [Portunus trituberculatus]